MDRYFICTFFLNYVKFKTVAFPQRSPIGEYYNQTKNALQELHSNFPNKPILACEFGRISRNDDREAEEQTRTFEDTFKAFKECAVRNIDNTINSAGYLAGCTWWAAFNWYTLIKIYGQHIESMGLIHMDRKEFKPVAYKLAEEYCNYTCEEDFNFSENLEKVRAYPNPWAADESSVNYVTFDNLTKNAVIRIYNINESFIKEIKEIKNNGTAKWYIDDFSGKLVKSGIYIYYILDKKLNLGKPGKIMVIR